jgi:hypothetical protein
MIGSIDDERIAARAYGIWEREGRPHGRDLDHWLSARTEIERESGSADDASATAPVGTVPPAPRRRARKAVR